MQGEWPTITLRDAGVRLLDCEHRTPPAATVGHPYIAIPQIIDGRLDFTTARRVSEDDYRNWTRRTCPQVNDVVVVRRCNSGDTAHVPAGVEFALGQNLVLLRSEGTRVLPEFLRWLARGPDWWEQIRKFMNVGAVFDSLKCADIPNFEIAIPPVREQASIVRLLGALDDKIELNRRMNETLEAMARALFKSWFVDFDPVRAKAEGRAPGGMDSETAALFPSGFEVSELGEIPSGWRVGTLGDVADAPRRLVDPGEIDGEVAYIGLEHMPRRSISLSEWETASKVTSQKARFEAGEILFGKLRPYFHKVGIAPSAGVCSTDIIVAAPKTPEMFALVLGHLASDELIKYSDQCSTGTKMPRVSWGDLARYSVVLPPAPLAEACTAITQALVRRMVAAIYESKSLAVMRDALLPKLLSGELRVSDAEKAVEQVA